ncbi:hypothetical protein VTI74DRAFT_7968 [Chaetomium olivicolor]
MAGIWDEQLPCFPAQSHSGSTVSQVSDRGSQLPRFTWTLLSQLGVSSVRRSPALLCRQDSHTYIGTVAPPSQPGKPSNAVGCSPSGEYRYPAELGPRYQRTDDSPACLVCLPWRCSRSFFPPSTLTSSRLAQATSAEAPSWRGCELGRRYWEPPLRCHLQVSRIFEEPFRVRVDCLPLTPRAK